MASLLKVISEVATLVESRLGLVVPLLTNNYDKWTQDPSGSWDVSPPTTCYASSPNTDADLHEYSIYRQFYLPNKAHASSLTISGYRYIDHPALGGTASARVTLVKPDSSEVTLYTGDENTGGWVNYLNGVDITSYLDQVGTYTMRFDVELSSGFAPPSTYYISTAAFGAITFTVNCNLPGQPTSLAGHAENTTQVHLTWVGGVETDSYVVYYRKREFTG